MGFNMGHTNIITNLEVELINKPVPTKRPVRKSRLLGYVQFFNKDQGWGQLHVGCQYVPGNKITFNINDLNKEYEKNGKELPRTPSRGDWIILKVYPDDPNGRFYNPNKPLVIESMDLLERPGGNPRTSSRDGLSYCVNCNHTTNLVIDNNQSSPYKDASAPGNEFYYDPEPLCQPFNQEFDLIYADKEWYKRRFGLYDHAHDERAKAFIEDRDKKFLQELSKNNQEAQEYFKESERLKKEQKEQLDKIRATGKKVVHVYWDPENEDVDHKPLKNLVHINYDNYNKYYIVIKDDQYINGCQHGIPCTWPTYRNSVIIDQEILNKYTQNGGVITPGRLVWLIGDNNSSGKFVVQDIITDKLAFRYGGAIKH
jgi:hypothetical protein